MARTAPGIDNNVIDRTYGVPQAGGAICGLVIHSNRGPTDVTLITSRKRFIDLYGEPSAAEPTKYAVLELLNEASRVQVKRVTVDAVTATTDIQESANTLFTVNAGNPGAWGNNIEVSFGSGPSDSALFRMFVYYNSELVEQFDVSRDDTKKDGYGNSLYIEDVVNNQSDYISVSDNTAQAGDPTTLIGSGSKTALTTGSDDSTSPTDAEISTGWDDFVNPADVAVDFLVGAGYATGTVQQKIVTVAEGRKDCFGFLDIPEADTTVSDMTTHVDTAGSDLTSNTSFAAVYAPWVQKYDAFTDRKVNFPPSAIAATIAVRSRNSGEIWDAPAGSRRGVVRGALKTTKIFTEGELETLYENNINPIQQFSGEGVLVWGQKTLYRTASALDRINVRFLVTYIQQNVGKALRPFVFQGNTEFERENIEAIIEQFLTDIKSRRGLYDFRVICDTSNNTPQVIDNNQLIVDVYIKPTRTAEFITLNTILTATGVQFN